MGGGGITLEQIIFNLILPFSGVDPVIVKSCINQVIIPTALLSLVFGCIVLSSKSHKFIIYCTKRLCLFLYKVAKKLSVLLYKVRIVVIILFIAIFGFITTQYLDENFKIFNYITSPKDYSTLYEGQYISPLDKKPIAPSKKRNLIIIYLESMEQTFSHAFETNLIPNLSQVAQQNLYIKNLLQLSGTSWSIAALTSYECGVPLKIPIDGNKFTNKYFLSNAMCLGDVLENNGYVQNMIVANGEFSGLANFYNTHNVTTLDRDYYVQKGSLPKDYKVGWGMEDKKTIEFAKEYLKNYKDPQPFALRVMTIDTHKPGFVDKHCAKPHNHRYKDSLSCSDDEVYKFVSWIQEQDFYKDTTIVILGDHYTMEKDFVPKNSKRSIYNAIINPANGFNIDSNRIAGHFDMYPTILASIGFDVDRLALGANIARKNETLIESLGEKELNKLINKKSRLYNSFWTKNNFKSKEKK